MKLGPLIVGIESTSLTARDRIVLRHPLVGGVILFARNFAHPTQLKALTTAIKNIKQPSLLIGVDHEGGRVQRFHEGFSSIPPMAVLGELYDEAPHRALRLAQKIGEQIARELLSHHIDLNFGPILDVNAGISEVIGDRAFHADPHIIVQLTTALVAGMHDQGMAAIGKHYPGHGSIAADTHLQSAIDDRSFEVIVQHDLVPFAQWQTIGLQGMMTAHVTYPQVDDCPVSFSNIWLRDILRQQLRFPGVIISDDLGMAAAKGFDSPVAATKAALNAGCDMVLLCNEMNAIDQVLAELPPLYDHHCTRQVLRLRKNRV